MIDLATAKKIAEEKWLPALERDLKFPMKIYDERTREDDELFVFVCNAVDLSSISTEQATRGWEYILVDKMHGIVVGVGTSGPTPARLSLRGLRDDRTAQLKKQAEGS